MSHIIVFAAASKTPVATTAPPIDEGKVCLFDRKCQEVFPLFFLILLILFVNYILAETSA